MQITQEHLESLIERKSFHIQGTMTTCYLTLLSGFTLIGYAACIHEEQFNSTKGKELAYANALERLGELEAYRIKHGIGRNYEYRLNLERTELRDKLTKLSEFLDKGKPAFISDEEWDLLHNQASVMRTYLDLLLLRKDKK